MTEKEIFFGNLKDRTKKFAAYKHCRIFYLDLLLIY